MEPWDEKWAGGGHRKSLARSRRPASDPGSAATQGCLLWWPQCTHQSSCCSDALSCCHSAFPVCMTPRCFPGGSAVKNPPVMQETRVWSLGGEDPLEEEMATHSSILAWEIPWTEGRLHDLVTEQQQRTCRASDTVPIWTNDGTDAYHW